MYDELVKRLRASVDGRYEKCDCCPYEEDYPCCVDCLDKMHKQAADAIEALSKIREEQKAQIILMAAEIEELKTYAELYQSLTDKSQKMARNLLDAYPKWIPVTERLPEPNAVDKYGFAKGYLVKTDRHVMMHTARYNGEWWILWGKAEVITDAVTHWMPLPKLPKEG